MTTVRNYIRGEWLPWGEAELGWPPEALDPEWTFVVFVDGKLTSLLVATKTMNALLLMRLLSVGNGAPWLRTLWRELQHVCWKREIVGFWSCMDNERDAERKLMQLLKRAAATVEEYPAAGSWIRGRF